MNETIVNRAKRVGILLLLLFVVPILGWLTSIYVESNFEGQFHKVITESQMTDSDYKAKGISYLGVCGTGGVLRQAGGNEQICAFADEIKNVRFASWATAASLSEILCLRHTIPPKELHAPHYNQVRCQRQIGTAANFSQAT